MADAGDRPAFFYDLASPACWLAAERVVHEHGAGADWRPVLASGLPGPAREPGPAELERCAERAGLLPVRWPPSWPPDPRPAMLAATYARRAGRAVAFSLAAFRQAFAGGRDLGDLDTVLLAGAACELHPAALTRALAMRSVAAELDAATARAAAAGVRRLPAILAGGQVVHLEEPVRREAA